MKKVIIEIEADGTSSIDAEGFKGQSCTLATREIELALAGVQTGVDDRKKPDFYATNPGAVAQRS